MQPSWMGLVNGGRKLDSRTAGNRRASQSYKTHINPNATSDRVLKVTRVTMVVIGLLGVTKRIPEGSGWGCPLSFFHLRYNGPAALGRSGRGLWNQEQRHNRILEAQVPAYRPVKREAGENPARSRRCEGGDGPEGHWIDPGRPRGMLFHVNDPESEDLPGPATPNPYGR